jgi:hypothetical protein
MNRIIAFLSLSLCLSCGQKHDYKLVGSWSGSEKDGQYRGITKAWIQNRHQDGTYEIVFMAIEDGDMQSVVETGKWWTENGKFYELEKDQLVPEQYTYEFLDSDNVKFKVAKPYGPFSIPNYTFIDNRVKQ